MREKYYLLVKKYDLLVTRTWPKTLFVDGDDGNEMQSSSCPDRDRSGSRALGSTAGGLVLVNYSHTVPLALWVTDWLQACSLQEHSRVLCG